MAEAYTVLQLLRIFPALLELGFMNWRWRLYWAALSILFLCELVWKTLLLHYIWINFGSQIQIPTSSCFQKCWRYFHYSSYAVGKYGNAGMLTRWETEIIWFKISAVCFGHHIISDGLRATLVSGTSPEIVLQAFL